MDMKITIKWFDENDIEIAGDEFLAIRFKNIALSPIMKQVIDSEKRNEIFMPTGDWVKMTVTMKKVV